MKTNQLMKRDFDGNTITQRTSDSFLNATELLQIYNDTGKTPKRFLEFWHNKGTQEFMEALAKELNSNGDNSHLLPKDLYLSTRGNGGSTYMHPYLFIKFAMWLSADFEVKVIKWVYDNLIKVRNDAGDHYLKMCDTIQEVYLNVKGQKPQPLIFIQEANFIKSLAFGYKEKERNEASEFELRLLNALQLANISLIKEGIPKDKRHEKLRDFAKMYS